MTSEKNVDKIEKNLYAVNPTNPVFLRLSEEQAEKYNKMVKLKNFALFEEMKGAKLQCGNDKDGIYLIRNWSNFPEAYDGKYYSANIILLVEHDKAKYVVFSKSRKENKISLPKSYFRMSEYKTCCQEPMTFTKYMNRLIYKKLSYEFYEKNETYQTVPLSEETLNRFCRTIFDNINLLNFPMKEIMTTFGKYANTNNESDIMFTDIWNKLFDPFNCINGIFIYQNFGVSCDDLSEYIVAIPIDFLNVDHVTINSIDIEIDEISQVLSKKYNDSFSALPNFINVHQERSLLNLKEMCFLKE